MIKKGTIAIAILFLYSSNCFAEGQYGLARFLTFVYFTKICLCIFIYAMIGGIIIKFILQKSNLLIKNQTYKAFSISLLITILATIIFGDDFIFYLWNHT